MINKSDKPLFILFHKTHVRYFRRRFSRKEREQFELIAFDGVVSMCLSQYNIPHYSTETLMKEDERRTLLATATDSVFDKLQHFARQSNKDRADSSVADFLDCIKYDTFLPFLSVIYQRRYYAALITKLQPSQISVFIENTIAHILLADTCADMGIPLYTYPIPWIWRTEQSVRRTLPFIAKPQGVGGRLLRLVSKQTMSFKDTVEQLQSQKQKGTIVLLTPFENRRTLKNTIRGLKALIPQSTYTLIPIVQNIPMERLGIEKEESSILPFEAPKPDSEKKSRLSTAGTPDFLPILRELFTDICHQRENIEKLCAQTQNFGLQNWYRDFLWISDCFDILFSSLRPSVFVGDNFFSFMTRVGVLRARKHKVESLALTRYNEELFAPPYQNKKMTIKNCALPRVVAVHQENTANLIMRHTLADDLSYSPTIVRMNRGTHTPHETSSDIFTILFTTQQHPYTFEYTTILARTVRSLAQKHRDTQIRLIVRPHPNEYAFLYHIAIGVERTIVSVDASTPINDALCASSILVTSHSFTGIEALEHGKRVILLNFSRIAANPDILLYRPPELIGNPLVSEVSTEAELEAALLYHVKKSV